MSPDDQPTAREFGELTGEVRAIGRQITEMKDANSREHAAVIQKLEGVQAGLTQKASENWVKEHEGRINSLEKTRDEGSGAVRLIRIGQGAGFLALAVLTYLAGKGGLS